MTWFPNEPPWNQRHGRDDMALVKQTIMPLLEQGASTEKLLDDGLLDGLKMCYGNMEWDGWFVKLVLLQELACAAGSARAIAFAKFGRRYEAVNQEWIWPSTGGTERLWYQFIFHHAFLGDGVIQNDWPVRIGSGKRNFLPARRLSLGLARVMLHVSALDQIKSMSKVNMFMFNPQSAQDASYWHTRSTNRDDDYEAYKLILDHPEYQRFRSFQYWTREPSFQYWTRESFPDEHDRPFIAEFLSCVSHNGLCEIITDEDRLCAAERYTASLGTWKGSVMTSLLYQNRFFSENESLYDTVIPHFKDRVFQNHLSRHFANKERRSHFRSYLRASPIARRWITTSRAGESLLQELVRMKERRILQILVEMEPDAMRQRAPMLLDFVKSKRVHGRKERVQALLENAILEDDQE
jgi:hypothetical protein